MSLLMDALKKAEEAKRAAGEGRTAETQAPRELELAPLEATKTETPSETAARQPTSSGVSPLPELSLHIESVDADLAAVSKEDASKRSPRKPAAAPSNNTVARTNPTLPADAERAAARNVFSAKQPAERRSALWFILPIGCLIAACIGAYYWWQLQSLEAGSLTVPPAALAQNKPLPAPAAPVVQPPAQQPAEAQDAANVPAAVAAAAPSPPSPAPTPTAAPARQDAAVKSSGTTGTREPARPTPQQPTAPAASPQESAGNLRLTRSQPVSNLTLEQAYDALQAGRFDVAQRAYQHVLRGDPKSTDALLGLATVAARQGDTARAHSYYQLALESDPNDATAQAGVIQTRGQSDPAQSESRLKTALASQPDSPALLFALGNLYASEQRWGEAQQAYFRAYSTEPDNADFIFNLAVSLDQLHQDKLAAQYYQMALNAAEAPGSARAVAFDRGQVQKRMQELLQ